MFELLCFRFKINWSETDTMQTAIDKKRNDQVKKNVLSFSVWSHFGREQATVADAGGNSKVYNHPIGNNIIDSTRDM